MGVTQNFALSMSRYVKILMDSSESASIIHKLYVSINKFNSNKWSTMARSFLTSFEAKVKIKFPELNEISHILAPFHVMNEKSNYNVIFGRDLLQELGISLDFQNNFVG